MKDYYKILGVEEEASEEEIRARWIELTKHYHPDLGKTEEGDGKIKEINEAYEILKNEPTRFSYDLERAFKRSLIKKAQRPKERRVHVRKIIVSAGLLVLFLVAGLISLKWFRAGSGPTFGVPGVPEKRDQVSGKRNASQIPPVKTESKVQDDQEVRKGDDKREVTRQESKEIVSVSPQLSASRMESASKKKEESSKKILPKPPAPLKVEDETPAKEEPKPVKGPVPRTAVKSEAPARVEKEVPKGVSEVVPKEVVKPDPRPAEKMAIKTEEERRVVSVPPPSLVKEEEVKRFFSNYTDQYRRKDIDGFLSLFSSKAVQNQKDGWKGIKSIYTKFFDQSRELRYRLERMKTEIYENGVEVKARFRVNQKLKKSGAEKVWKGNIRWVLVKEEGNLKIISLDYQNENPSKGRKGRKPE